MNAGAFGGETWRHVVEVETIDRGGREHRRPASEYRGELPARRAAGATRSGSSPRGCASRSARPSTSSEVQALLERRKATQPIGEWSCGSVFTNPPGDHAARLIEAAGLKGLRDRRRLGVAQARQLHHQSRRGHGRGRRDS